MGKNDIRLSPKYGVNPTIPICFWCGKEKNEIALMGRIGDGRKGEDIEAPKNAVLNYDPCEECLKKWSLGVALLEVLDGPTIKNQPSFFQENNVYPTGRYCVIKQEAFKRIFERDIPKKKICLVDREIFEQLTKGEN